MIIITYYFTTTCNQLNRSVISKEMAEAASQPPLAQGRAAITSGVDRIIETIAELRRREEFVR